MSETAPEELLATLRADCARCVGLCCVAPAFAASSDFAIDKPAGTPCPNLRADFACSVHDRLRPLGFPGCTVYDCQGAGQKVAGSTYAGRDWRSTPELKDEMFAVFGVVRDLHELLWYLADALTRPAAAVLRPELRAALETTERLTFGAPAHLLALDVDGHRRGVDTLLRRTSELVRDGVRRDRTELARADLSGRRLRDLRGADLRGAWLLGADLRGATLDRADVIGADLRGCDVSGADLSTALFLTQPQVNAARGDARTALPAVLQRPTHWEPAA